jgi:ABC-type branched-subunit amino acid transport system substrate-binding protein
VNLFKPNRGPAALTVALLFSAVAGCGGTTDAAAVDSCASPGVSADQVAVGLVYPDTGALAPAFTAARSGFQARLSLANADGGVQGRRVDVRWVDDGGLSTTNAVVVTDLVRREGVFGVAELTIAASGSASYLAEAGVPVVGLATESVWNDYDNMFAASYQYASGGSVSTFGDFVVAQGGTKVAIVEDPLSQSARRYSDQLVASMDGRGVETVARIPFTAGQNSATRTAEAVAESGADVLVGEVTADSFREVLVAARQRGLTFRVALSPTAYDKALLARAGQDLAGMTAFFTHIPFESDSPSLASFRHTMRTYAPETADPDQPVVLGSYVAADMFLRGLEAVGTCPTRADFLVALRALTHYDAAGLIPGGVDLSTNRGKLAECYSFATVNAEGNAFVAVPAPDGSAQWCGTRLGA